jgi:hypothetical protein
MHKRYKMAGAALYCAALSISSLSAQQSSGSFNGTVTDATGAVVANATVSITNVETSVIRTAMTNGSGIYVLSNVLPGTYAVSIQKEGFETIRKTGTTLGVNQALTVNFQMMVGNESTNITVQATAAQLEASTAELGSVIGKQVVEDLPLNGREFTQLLMLTPGASRANTAQNSGGGFSPSTGPVFFPAMHGQSNRSNYFMLDGINDNEDVFATFAVSPTVDDIQEFKVQSHNDQAEFGGVTGGIVNIVTKSGTNHLHGALWEFNRNNVFGASNPITMIKLPLNQNQFGGNVGGPLIIPHLYSGLNKTFLFFSYEGFRRTSSSGSSFSIVPTAAQLNGDFSGVSNPLYNPATTRSGPNGTYIRDAFPNNQINPATFNPLILAYEKLLIPAPNASNVSGNYINNLPTVESQNNFNGRVDETIDEKDTAWFRYSTGNQPQSSFTYPYLSTLTTTATTNYGLNYLHTFNSSLTLDVQFGHNFISNVTDTRYSQGTNALLQQLPFSTAFACGYAAYGASQDCLVPNVSINGYAGGGESSGHNNPSTDLYQYNADLSKVLGHHFIQAGGLFIRSRFAAQDFGTPDVGFTASQTADPQNASSTGNALASALLGAVDNSNNRATIADVSGVKLGGGYVQDQWKAASALTINVGLRYDVLFWPRYGQKSLNDDAIGEIDFSNGTYILQRAVGDCATVKVAPCIPGGLTNVPNVVVSPDGHLWRNSYDNVQPRIGFSYQASSKDVIRGAFGVFFDEWSSVKQTVQGIGGDWPSVAQPSAQNQTPLTAVPTVDPANPLGGVASLPAATPFTQSQYYRDPHAKNPESEQFNFGFQHLINANTTLEVDYVGSHTYRLITGGGLYNVARTPGPGDATVVASRQPYPNITPTHYDRSNGNGNYNGLETKLSQTTSHGLQYILSYTYSKTMNTACDGLFGAEGCSEPDPYNLRNDYSVAGYDLKHNLSASVTYDLPVGRGKLLNINNRALNAAVGGWQVNAIYAFTSGLPYNLGVSADIANTGNPGTARLDRIGNPRLSHPTRAEWFNKAAFASPAPYTFGTEGRNDLRGDPFQDADLSLFKNLQIQKLGNLQFRAEAFNALNHLTYATPDGNISDTTFGVVGGERSTERQLQLAVKFLF